ncbi:hypothetical protein [Arthrobacter sp. B6]|nr:hypothetical protein [Arthrobacter sp. B6]
MTDDLPPCPACSSPYADEMGALLVSPDGAGPIQPTSSVVEKA